jgi:hypothetical protein
LPALDEEQPVFLSTMLNRAVFDDTIKIIKPNRTKNFFVGGVSKNEGISEYSATQNNIGNNNAISQTSSASWIS